MATRKIARSRVFVWTLLVVGLLGLGLQASDSLDVVGQVSASEPDIEEGYFAVGQNVMLIAKPGTDLHKWMEAHIGENLRITVQVEGSTQ